MNLYSKICELKDKGLTYKQISNRLNELGYEPTRGKVGEFTPQKVWSNYTKIKKNKESTSLVSVHEVAEPPAKMFGMNGNYLHGLSPFDPRKDYYTLPRQEFPPTYFGNGYIDIIKTKTILKDNSFYGPRMLGYITQNIGEIDLPEDLKTIDNKLYFISNKNKIISIGFFEGSLFKPKKVFIKEI